MAILKSEGVNEDIAAVDEIKAEVVFGSFILSVPLFQIPGSFFSVKRFFPFKFED